MDCWSLGIFTFCVHQFQWFCFKLFCNWFWCSRMRPHLTFWCVGMRPHVSGGSDAAGWDCVSRVSLPHCPIVHITLSSVRLCHDVSLITIVLCGMKATYSDLFYFILPKGIYFIHNICPCFLYLFRLFCTIVLMFHNFLQPNWCLHWKWILMFMTGTLVQLVTNIATVLHRCQSNCA